MAASNVWSCLVVAKQVRIICLAKLYGSFIENHL